MAKYNGLTLQTQAAITIGKIASFISRRLHIGGGTNFPGTLARRIDPNILGTLAAALPQGVILLSGTNGKTTTTRMIAALLQANKYQVLHNRAGANLVTGLTATALTHCNVSGQLKADIGLFETDEAALSQAIAETNPRLVVIHNLFRDQLDRYGEVDSLALAWNKALKTLPASSLVLLNADDPAVAYLGNQLTSQVCYYGLEDIHHATGSALHTADSQFCRRCGARYHYTLSFYGHMGHYVCETCGHQRPNPHIRLERLDLQGDAGSRLFITYPDGAVELEFPLPGLYNALNALAAIAAGLMIGIAPSTIRNELETFHAAFGRIERVQAGWAGTPMLIALIKNPVGASETVRMLTDSTTTHGLQIHMMISINDRDADGTDVSWLWDAEFEPLADHVAHVVVSGTRAADMAVRLKYAGVSKDKIVVEPNQTRALDKALATLPTGATLFILPTYTAMLELRKEFTQRKWVRPFWEE